MSTTYLGRHRPASLPWTTHALLLAVCVLLQLLAFWDDTVSALRRALTDPDAWVFAVLGGAFVGWVLFIARYH